MGKALEFILSEPWAIQQEALEQILLIAQRAHDNAEFLESRLGRPLEEAPGVDIREGGTAIVSIRGPIFRYANLFTEISGATSLEILARDFETVASDPSVRNIVLNIDSPGGQAKGISEFAAMIRAAEKPVIAYIDGIGASAAYWIAAAANRIVISDTALLGSIGTVATYRPEKDGPIRIVSTQTPLKQAAPDTPEGRMEAQRIVDELTDVFVYAVARYRSTTRDHVLARFGRGSLLIGAQCVLSGMADEMGLFEPLISSLTDTTKPGIISMSEKPSVEVTAEWLQSEHPEIYQEIMDLGADAAIETLGDSLRAEGAEVERKRIRDVLDQSMPGHESLVERLAFDGSTTPEQAAVQILAAEKKIRGAAHKALVDETPPPVPSGSTESGGHSAQGDDNLPIDERCKHRWARDRELHAEFGELDTYIAYARAEADGKIKKLTGGKVA